MTLPTNRWRMSHPAGPQSAAGSKLFCGTSASAFGERNVGESLRLSEYV